MATPTAPHPSTEAPDVPLADVLAQLRKAQTGPDLAEQRHQFLDIDPDLAGRWDGATVHIEPTDDARLAPGYPAGVAA